MGSWACANEVNVLHLFHQQLVIWQGGRYSHGRRRYRWASALFSGRPGRHHEVVLVNR